MCYIELRVDKIAAVCWVRYRTASGFVSSSCVGCDIELRVDMLAGAVSGAILLLRVHMLAAVCWMRY